MRKFLLGLSIFFIDGSLFAQQGLENIIVEKYYISDKTDAKTTKGGRLPSGSVTYRIYADLLPGFRFQAAYGVQDHELRIATSTSFFNNEEFGRTTANDIPIKQLNSSNVMLDSWLSVGAAAAGCLGILKEDDDTVGTIVNIENPKVLQSENPEAGIPVKMHDGLKSASPISVVTFFGLDKELQMFGNKNENTNGAVFSTNNGSWASFGGAIGPNSDNKILIAQITTNGVFSFELNIQIGTPDGRVQNFVAKGPKGNEIQKSFLTYLSGNTKASENHNK